MGNTPSTPPALVSVNAGGNEILVPTGTSLYACPPPTPGGYHPPYSCGPREARGPIYRVVDPPYDRTRPRRKRHGRADVDLNIREYHEESESTDLGELPEPMRMRKGSKTPEIRMPDGRRGVPAPYDIEPRPSSTPAGYVGMRRESQSHLGVHPQIEEAGFNSNTVHMRPGMYPTMPYLPPHPGILPTPTLPPKYVSREPKPSYPAGVGISNMNSYAPYPLQSPPSNSSPPPSPESALSQLPPGVQAAIDAAVQRSTGLARKPKLQTNRSKPSLAGLSKKNSDTLKKGCGEGVDACVCTTKCKCRKAERSTDWHEGMADTDGEKVPVKGKLNARWVFNDGTEKNSTGHMERRKNYCSSSSSSNETETSGSRHVKKNKSRRKSKKEKNTENDKSEEGKSEIDKVTKGDIPPVHRPRHPPLPLAGTDFNFDLKDMEELEPTILKQMKRLHIGTGVNPYGIGRMDGTNGTRGTQRISEPVAMGNRHSLRMQPKGYGVRTRRSGNGFMDNYEGVGGTSLGSLYARPKARGAKGRNRYLLHSMGQPGIRFQGSLLQPESESRTVFRRGVGRRAGDRLDAYHVRDRRLHPRFEPDDSEISLRPERRLRNNSIEGNEDGEAMTYKLLTHCIGNEDKGAHPRSERPHTGPLGGKNAPRNERDNGRQPYAETDDDEDY